MPKDAIWLVPGLRIKRWFALIVLGSVLAAIGITLVFRLEPIYFIVSTAKKIFHVACRACLYRFRGIHFYSGMEENKLFNA